MIWRSSRSLRLGPRSWWRSRPRSCWRGRWSRGRWARHRPAAGAGGTLRIELQWGEIRTRRRILGSVGLMLYTERELRRYIRERAISEIWAREIKIESSRQRDRQALWLLELLTEPKQSEHLQRDPRKENKRTGIRLTVTLPFVKKRRPTSAAFSWTSLSWKNSKIVSNVSTLTIF